VKKNLIVLRNDMEIKDIIFFNFFRNGDCFISKEYVRELIKYSPNIRCKYAHGNHPSIVADLDCDFIPLDDLHKSVNPFVKLMQIDESGTLYINTWIGCWVGEYLHPGVQDNANFVILYSAWSELYQLLGLRLQSDPMAYLPSINWDIFDLTHANQFLEIVRGKPLLLFCNGKQQSLQSDMGDMKDIVETLALEYSDHEFLLTYPVQIDLPNVHFTENIFKEDVGRLNDIAYISQHSKIIFGKNSGPFSYAHTRQNLYNPDLIYLSFSKKIKECLTGDGLYRAKTFFSDITETTAAVTICKKLIDTSVCSDLNFDRIKKLE